MTAIELSDGIAQRVGVRFHLYIVGCPLTTAECHGRNEGDEDTLSASHGIFRVRCLQHLKQFNIEDECGEWWNHLSSAVLAIT